MALSRKRPTQRMGKENGSGNKSIDSIHPSPPSPFRLGWKSVIPSDYPYPIPSTQEPLESQQVAPNARLPQTGSSEESHSALPSGKPQATCPPTSVQTESTKPLPEINNPHQITQVQKTKAAAASSTQLTAKHREENQTKSIPSPPQPNKPRIQEKPPNTKALFIPKTKKPIKRKLSQIPDGLALDNNINPVSKDPLDSIQPIHTSLDTRNNIEKDPFADWDSPSQHEIEAEMKSRTEETNQEDTERIQETKNDQEVADRNLEEEMKEIEKPLKLDRNLLELIIRMVLLQIKLSESSKNHVDALEVLSNFKKQTIGLHKTHAVLFEKKLTEAVDKLLLIQSEYNRLSNLIDIDLKSSIEISVSKNKSILNAPSLNSNGIFGDNWIPKPVIHLESSAVSSSMDNLNPRSTFDQPTKSSLQSDLPKESIKSSNINNNDSWGWGNDTENTTTNPDPTHESENKVVECPWGAEEPEEITPKPNEAQPGPATNPEESFGWGGNGEGNDNHRGGGGGQGNYNDRGGGASWSGKSNNNDTGGWSNQNVDNDSGGWNNQNSNTSAINMDTNNSSEFRPRDSGWGGMRNGRGGRGGGFSNDQSGFRGRGFGFRGDRGFRSRGGGDRGGFTGRSRGFDGSGFGGRGRGFGNRGGSWSGSGDSGFNNNENNSFSEGFRGGNGNGFGFGETSQGFNSGYSGQNDNRDKGGWGDDNGSQSGFGNAGNDSKGVSGGDSKNTFGGGWYNSGDDSYGGFNASGKASGGGGDDSIMKTGGGGGFGMSGSTGGDRCQPPKVPSNRAMVQYDTLAPGNLITNDGNEWSSANPSTTLQPSQVNATGGKQAGDISTNDDNGWGSPPSKEHVEIPSGDKNFRDLDGGSPVDNLPLKLDYGGETLINKTAKDLNHINPPVSAKEAIETAPVNTSPNTKMVPGNEENECPW